MRRSSITSPFILLNALALVACGNPPDLDAGSDAATLTDSGARDGQDAMMTGDAGDARLGDVGSLDGIGTDVSSSDATESDVTSLDVVGSDVSPGDVLATDSAPVDASIDAAGDARGDATAGDTAVGDAGTTASCTSDATCGGGTCLVGRCYRISDQSLPIATIPSPDRCRLRIGVDHPGGAPFRVLSVVAGSTGDTGYASVLAGGMWSRTTLSTNVNGYTTPKFRRAMSGVLENDFVQGTTVYLGAAGGAVAQSGLSSYAAAYSPTAELVVATKNAGTGMFSTPYPLRLWRRTAGTWASDLVSSNIGTDGIGELHFRTDGAPDVLVFQTTRISLFRKALDVWNSTLLYTGPGTHGGGEVTIPDPAGGSHVIMGTRVFTIDLSVGELTLDYLHIASDGTISRMVRLPVGGHGYALRDATIDLHGNLHVMVTAPASGGRYATHVVRITPAAVTSSVIANFETTIDVCSLAVAPDATMYLAAYQGSTRPVLLRTYAP